jgi:hypothetical protein
MGKEMNFYVEKALWQLSIAIETKLAAYAARKNRIEGE